MSFETVLSHDMTESPLLSISILLSRKAVLALCSLSVQIVKPEASERKVVLDEWRVTISGLGMRDMLRLAEAISELS